MTHRDPTDLVPAWLEHLTTDRAMAPNTVATYARTLRTLPDAPTETRAVRTGAWCLALGATLALIGTSWAPVLAGVAVMFAGAALVFRAGIVTGRWA